MIKKIIHKILLILFLFSAQISAIDLGEDVGEHLRINGFATVGASTIFENGQEFRAYTFQRDGVRKDEVNFVNNTLLGLQAELLLTDSLSATVQGLVINDYD